jgi:CRP/FNR family transcriptional regulator
MDAREALQHMHLFRGAGSADLDAVALIAEPKSYTAGQCIFDQGHPADALYAIVLGTVDIKLPGKDRAVVTFGSGQTLGEGAFFERSPRRVSAYTRESTRVVCFPFEQLDRVLAERPDLALCFYRNAATAFARHATQLVAERDRPYF